MAPGAIQFRLAGWLDGRGARRVGDEALYVLTRQGANFLRSRPLRHSPPAPPGRHRLGARASRPHPVPLAAVRWHQSLAAGRVPITDATQVGRMPAAGSHPERCLILCARSRRGGNSHRPGARMESLPVPGRWRRSRLIQVGALMAEAVIVVESRLRAGGRRHALPGQAWIAMSRQGGASHRAPEWYCRSILVPLVG